MYFWISDGYCTEAKVKANHRHQMCEFLGFLVRSNVGSGYEVGILEEDFLAVADLQVRGPSGVCIEESQALLDSGWASGRDASSSFRRMRGSGEALREVP